MQTHRKENQNHSINTKKQERLMEKKEMYVAPEVEILEVAVEKGFAGSVVDGPDFGDDGTGGVDLP